MSSGRDRLIPQDVLAAQIAASDPSLSAWVAANAGSGKTYVLAQRVMRLMLNGTPPAKILCLTFTKAAAANMANQVFDKLAHWVGLDDGELDRLLMSLEGEAPSPARRVRARRLFAATLEAPGGLKVQTIHAFCARLLQQFPFEAKVPPGFAVLEERGESQLISRVRLELLLEIAGDADHPLASALSTAMAAAGERGLAAVIEEIIAKRDQLEAFVAAKAGIAGAIAELGARLGVAPDATLSGLDAEITQSPYLPVDAWRPVAALLASGQALDRAQSQRLMRAAEHQGEERSRNYAAFFLTGPTAPRQQLLSKALATAHPEICRQLLNERERLLAWARKRCTIRTRDRTAALWRFASAVLDGYRREKAAGRLLDYADLIDHSLALLRNVEAAWVHFKLDLGIDHVLIDEAQDTSPKQWEIIKRLVAEFTAGEGARAGIARSIFAVGDEKQSIFSFQDAAPEAFAANAEAFERAHRQAGLKFLRQQLKHSFRSGANLLSAVDAVFGQPAIAASMSSDPASLPRHRPLPDARPGMVEIWPLMAARKPAEIEAWDAPFDEVSEHSPQVMLAGRIAAAARSFLAAGRRPGELLVLVRQRGPLFEAILRGLKQAGLAVAGADRLVLTEHIAVMDLLVLADALLLPGDDLALATVLKSPLFGFDDELLFRLAWQRQRPLRTTLRERAGEDLFWAEAAAKLERLDEIARHETPFGFYAHLLSREQGRKHMLTRLGAEAADPIDEFLNLALAYERHAAPSLQGFIDHVRSSATEVKRDMDSARDEVRVMTVHGAKGLEAPIVILADTTTRPHGPRDPRLLALPSAGDSPEAPPCLVWAGAKDDDTPQLAQARADARRLAQDEYHRLLYVAMTRAVEVLIVCGAQGLNGKPADCWYDLVCNALLPQAEKQVGITGQGEVFRWQVEPQPPPAAVGETPPRATALRLPEWLTREARPLSARALRPSANGPQSAARLPGDRLRVRGRVLHQLLQSLPELAPERRALAGQRYIERQLPELSPDQRSSLLDEVLAVLAEPALASWFGPASRAEVPVVGRIPRAHQPDLWVSGQVDRLAVSASEVRIADFKSDRPAPKCSAEVPQPYVTQLAIYRVVLACIYPQRAVRAGVIFTETAAFIEIPPAVLEQAMSSVLAS